MNNRTTQLLTSIAISKNEDRRVKAAARTALRAINAHDLDKVQEMAKRFEELYYPGVSRQLASWVRTMANVAK